MARTHTRSLAVALVVVVLMAIAAPAMAGHSVETPIRENMTGGVVGIVFAPNFPFEGDTFGGRCSVPSQWISTSSGSGTMSHLGKVTWTTEHCYQMFAGAFGTFGDAELVVTAANGDQLFGTYNGVMTSETTFVETVVFTGGTGRFAGATGTVAETGWFDPVTYYMEITGVGSIVYDASMRSSME